MNQRINVIFIFFILIFIAVTARLFFWQIWSSEKLSSLAEKQRLVSLVIPAQRGKILSSDGNPLVINQTAYKIILEPKKMQEKDKILSVISKELNVDVSSISAKLNNSAVWVPVADKTSEDVVEKIRKNNFSGVIFSEESKRYYPEASMAAHILGFVGKNSKGEDQGYFGLEGYYDEQLKGRDGLLNQESDAIGNPILAGDLIKILPENGRDLKLYLDKTIQFIVEKRLQEGISKYGAKGGSAVVLQPSTGGVLAMASFPSYDPSRFLDFPPEFYKNPGVSLFYEPGSTFKTIVMASAINEGKVSEETKYNEEGSLEIGGYTINTWNQKYHGEINMAEVLQYSSNVGMVFVEKQLGSDLFLKYIDNLGFGKLTGIDLQEESTPELRSKNKWSEIDFATSSFGQGIAVTPLQMVRSVSAIANNGKLMQPHVVKSIKLSDGREINTEPKIDKVIFTPEVASLVTEMMVSAVENGETKRLKPPGIKVAGKTGTAQIAISGHYDVQKTIASFVGFSPPENPKFVMLVTITEPTSSPWGSETAAPIFFAITKDLLSYLGISPTN